MKSHSNPRRLIRLEGNFALYGMWRWQRPDTYNSTGGPVWEEWWEELTGD